MFARPHNHKATHDDDDDVPLPPPKAPTCLLDMPDCALFSFVAGNLSVSSVLHMAGASKALRARCALHGGCSAVELRKSYRAVLKEVRSIKVVESRIMTLGAEDEDDYHELQGDFYLRDLGLHWKPPSVFEDDRRHKTLAEVSENFLVKVLCNCKLGLFFNNPYSAVYENLRYAAGIASGCNAVADDAGGCFEPVSYTHLTLPTTPYV